MLPLSAYFYLLSAEIIDDTTLGSFKNMNSGGVN